MKSEEDSWRIDEMHWVGEKIERLNEVLQKKWRERLDNRIGVTKIEPSTQELKRRKGESDVQVWIAGCRMSDQKHQLLHHWREFLLVEQCQGTMGRMESLTNWKHWKEIIMFRVTWINAYNELQSLTSPSLETLNDVYYVLRVYYPTRLWDREGHLITWTSGLLTIHPPWSWEVIRLHWDALSHRTPLSI